jgi:hypothetical protein
MTQNKYNKGVSFTMLLFCELIYSNAGGGGGGEHSVFSY